MSRLQARRFPVAQDPVAIELTDDEDGARDYGRALPDSANPVAD